MQKCEHPIPVRFQFFLINLYLILKVANSNYRHGFRIGLKLKGVEAFWFSTILLAYELANQSEGENARNFRVENQPQIFSILQN